MNSGAVISTLPPALVLASTPHSGLGYEYELECDIDFFKELKKMSAAAAATNECDQPTAETTPRCLITDDKLTKDHIKLECGHKFNYVPLFKEVLFQKCPMLPKNLSAKLVTTYTKVGATNIGYQFMQSQTPPPAVLSMTYNSSYNLETTKLQYNQIKCPYCRAITSSILPYYPYPDVCKVKYVNTPTNLSLPALSCDYHSYISREHGKPDDSTRCKTQCIYNAKYDLMLCTKHLNKLDSRSDSAGAGAGSDSSSPTRKLTTSPPQTRSRVSKKKQHPPPLPNPETENVIISHHNPATAACTFILLSGARKGTPCGKPMWVSNQNPLTTNGAYCKAHYYKGTPSL